MDVKGKSGWGLPILVAVGVLAYYCTTLRVSPDPQHRRQAIHRRLYDGASPRTLLQEGYTRAELLEAGVPSSSLSPRSPASPSDASRSGQSDIFSASPDDGVFAYLCGSLAHVSQTVCAASDALVSGLRGRSRSTSFADTKTGPAEPAMGDYLTKAAPPSPSPPAKAVCSRAAHFTSIRLAASLMKLRGEAPAAAAAMSSTTTSPERARSRTPGGATQVHLAALSAAVTRGYTEESATHRYPLEVLRFLHEDGSRLSLMAESCAAVARDDGGCAFRTETYVQRSLSRAQAAADDAKTYFKVKLSTAARNIATTVMERYVNVHVGPSPVILAAFYLVAHDVAYTIQLQTHTGAYEERLADLLYTAQSARLVSVDSAAQRRGIPSGHNVCVLQLDGVAALYAVELPVCLVCHVAAPVDGHARSRLTLTPSSGGDGMVCPSAVVEVHPRTSSDIPPRGARTLFGDAHVVITLTTAQCEVAGTWSTSLHQVTAWCASADDGAAATDLSSHAFHSAFFTLPLPLPELFCTTVCEHPHDVFVTLFIAPATSPAADPVEMELRCVNGLRPDDLDAFFAFLRALFITPSHPQHTVNAAGQKVFAMEGLAVSPAETSLRVYGVEVAEGSWLVMRWLYADSTVFPRELEQYRRALTDEVVCVA